jgi:hypothetical protein
LTRTYDALTKKVDEVIDDRMLTLTTKRPETDATTDRCNRSIIVWVSHGINHDTAETEEYLAEVGVPSTMNVGAKELSVLSAPNVEKCGPIVGSLTDDAAAEAKAFETGLPKLVDGREYKRCSCVLHGLGLVTAAVMDGEKAKVALVSGFQNRSSHSTVFKKYARETQLQIQEREQTIRCELQVDADDERPVPRVRGVETEAVSRAPAEGAPGARRRVG